MDIDKIPAGDDPPNSINVIIEVPVGGEPGNVDDLADKLRRVLTADPAEYRRMQQASLDGVEIHDIERTLDTFEKLYRGEPL